MPSRRSLIATAAVAALLLPGVAEAQRLPRLRGSSPAAPREVPRHVPAHGHQVLVPVPWGWGFFGPAYGYGYGYGPGYAYDPYDPWQQQRPARRDTTPRQSAADSTVRALRQTRGVRAADPLLPWQVDVRAVRADTAPPPGYPALLANRRIPGRVLAQFVVDAAGRPDSASLRFLLSTDRAFADAVAAWLPTTRWRPARKGGVAVSALVEETFTFR